MIEAAKPYWVFRQKYNDLAPTAKKLVLRGGALLLLRDTPSPAVKKRLAAFITTECIRHAVPDETVAFL